MSLPNLTTYQKFCKVGRIHSRTKINSKYAEEIINICPRNAYYVLQIITDMLKKKTKTCFFWGITNISVGVSKGYVRNMSNIWPNLLKMYQRSAKNVTMLKDISRYAQELYNMIQNNSKICPRSAKNILKIYTEDVLRYVMGYVRQFFFRICPRYAHYMYNITQHMDRCGAGLNWPWVVQMSCLSKWPEPRERVRGA